MKFLILPLLLAFALPLQAQLFSLDEEGTTWAVVYGISEYQEVAPSLKYADKDAQEFAKYLTGYAKVPAANIRLRVNKEATTGNIWTDLAWLKEKSQKGDRAIIYFSGHGSKETQTSLGMGFLLTYNSPKTNYPAGAFGIQYLKAMVNDISQKGATVLLITDACRSGMIAENQLQGMDAATASLKEQFVNEIKILSCEPGQLSWEDARWGGGRSVFSYKLIEGLTGAADADKNGQITLLEIENYLENTVPREVAPKKQLPFAVGSKETVIAYVTPGTGGPAPAAATPAQDGASLASKGVEEPSPEALALENNFQKALSEGRLLMPMRDCADYYYQKLLGDQSVASKHADYKLDLAGALQDASLAAYNIYAKSDSLDLARMYKSDENITLYPAYLKRASDLLGKDHYLYNTLKSRELYFEGLLKRMEYFEAGKDKEVLKEAIAKQEEALQYEEVKTADAYFEMGVLQYDGEDYTNAILNFKKAVELSPGWAMPYDYLTGCYLILGKLDDAEKMARKALEVAPDDLQAYLKGELASVLEAKGQISEARALRKECAGLDTDDPRLQYELGQMYFDEKDFATAAKIFREIVAKEPGWQVAWLALGITLRDDKKYDEAQVAFEKLLSFDPNSTRYLYEAGANYYYKGENEKAAELVEKMLSLAPTDEFGNYLLKAIYESMGDSEKLRELEDRKLSNADQLDRLKTEAVELYEAGNAEKAELTCLQILSIAPSDKEAGYILGVIYHNSERFFEAIELLDPMTAGVAPGDFPELYYLLAACFAGIGELDWALEEIDILLHEIEDSLPDVYQLKGSIHEALGQTEEAQKAYAKYKELTRD
ncbi:MAG: caspase family protein [Saprospiraceae bacterium]